MFYRSLDCLSEGHYHHVDLHFRFLLLKPDCFDVIAYCTFHLVNLVFDRFGLILRLIGKVINLCHYLFGFRTFLCEIYSILIVRPPDLINFIQL
jgi:hypothetical protein